MLNLFSINYKYKPSEKAYKNSLYYHRKLKKFLYFYWVSDYKVVKLAHKLPIFDTNYALRVFVQLIKITKS